MKRSVLLALLLLAAPAAAQEKPVVKHVKDVIYGRKHGMVLTMDVFAPAKSNGIGVIWVVSGGWFSSHATIDPASQVFAVPFLERGYTVFAVVHGSQPKFTIPEILEDMHRATRFIRSHAKDYKIDPERIGITGGSAGGHLSLMQGLAGDLSNDKAKDPIDRVSSRVQAVACLYPPTDFLNYGKTGEDALGRGILAGFKAPFVFQEFDKQTRSFVPITDEEKFKEIGRHISPINHVSKDDPPTLILHGDADKLVPIQQAEILIAKLKEAGVPAELAVKKGAGHGWPNLLQDVRTFADWFDRHLRASSKD
jgi:acetyl esterase/lipase